MFLIIFTYVTWNSLKIDEKSDLTKYSKDLENKEKRDLVICLAVDGNATFSDFFEVLNEYSCYWTRFSIAYHSTININ